MALMKYEMKCSEEDCGKRVFILVSPEEIKVPNICPFCGGESSEYSEDETSE